MWFRLSFVLIVVVVVDCSGAVVFAVDVVTVVVVDFVVAVVIPKAFFLISKDIS